MKHCHSYFSANPLSVDSFFLKLCAKMSLANESAGFFKVQYLKKVVRDQANLHQSFLQVDTIVLVWATRNA